MEDGVCSYRVGVSANEEVARCVYGGIDDVVDCMVVGSGGSSASIFEG